VVSDGILSDGKASVAAIGTPLDGLRRALNDPDALLPFLIHTASFLAVAGVHVLVLLLIMHVSLLNGPDFWEHILEHASETWIVTLQKMGQRAREVLRATYIVHGLTAVVAFAMALPVFWFILGPPNFFLAAVLCFVFQLIPFLGSSVLVVAMVFYYFLEGQPMRAWECLFIALPLVAGVADLVVRPMLARSMGKILGVTMLIGFMAGMEAFGTAGFVLGPLVLELFVCFTAIMLYGPAYESTYLYPPREGLENRE
jgi:predicted PurR-regulated permease PerM